jgi:hypothetical protein
MKSLAVIIIFIFRRARESSTKTRWIPLQFRLRFATQRCYATTLSSITMVRNSPRKPRISARVTSTHRRFGEQLDRNGVVFARSCVRPPVDLDELLRDLNRQRDSKSPSECDYRAYLEVVDTSYNEDTMTRAFDSLAKVQSQRPKSESSRYITAYNMMWTETSTPIQSAISNPKPDIMEALTTTAYPPEALERLSGSLAPTKYPPAMPAFVVHAKGPNGPMDEAEKQCAYGKRCLSRPG